LEDLQRNRRIRGDYSAGRPLEDVPWLVKVGSADQRKVGSPSKQLNYFDRAERSVGRKTTWGDLEDVSLQRKLVGLYARYINDLLMDVAANRSAAFKSKRAATRKSRVVRQLLKDSQSQGPDVLRAFARQHQDVIDQQKSKVAEDDDDGPVDSTPRASTADGTDTQLPSAPAEERRTDSGSGAQTSPDLSFSQREAVMRRSSLATEGLTSDFYNHPRSTGFGSTTAVRSEQRMAKELNELPFLRHRVADDPSSLDPSLKQWADAAFAADYPMPQPLAIPKATTSPNDAAGVEQPNSRTSDTTEAAAKSDGNSPEESETIQPMDRHASGKMHRKPNAPKPTLKQVLQELTPNYDAEGVYYKADRAANQKPKPWKPKLRTQKDEKVVKVPWKTLAERSTLDNPQRTAAQEKVLRLTRDEVPGVTLF
jgi:hypothetical protein